jgi:preprotein translocase subunit Sss1
VLKHIIKQDKGKEFFMEEKKQATNAVKSIFKNGRMPTREEYTSLWIRMINQIERAKANQ